LAVFVLDKQKNPLMPCSEKRARLLLSRKKAVVHLMYPFTIRLKERVGGCLQSVHLKLDPGAKTTGVAVLVELQETFKVAMFAHLEHNGFAISEKLTQRRAFRRRRRNQLWYRQARFDNRTKPKGWLAPSIQHRVDSTLSWVKKISNLCPVSDIGFERVKFDIQKMQNPEISGFDYQQGTLFGLELKEYLLYKHNHQCAYCSGISKDPILEVEHVQPRSKGGSNSVKNLVIACRACNEAKGALLLTQWKNKLSRSALAITRIKGIDRVLSGKWRGFRDTAAVNATRNALLADILTFSIEIKNKEQISVYTGTGAMTKLNRKLQGLPKDHAIDAAVVGENPKHLQNWQVPVLSIKSTGRGAYKRTRLDKFGFPRGYLMRQKSVQGFQTGDMVKALVLKGKKQGEYLGRIAVRASGSFNIQSKDGLIQGISHKCCTLLQRNNGYGFCLTKIALTNGEERKAA